MSKYYKYKEQIFSITESKNVGENVHIYGVLVTTNYIKVGLFALPKKILEESVESNSDEFLHKYSDAMKVIGDKNILQLD